MVGMVIVGAPIAAVAVALVIFIVGTLVLVGFVATEVILFLLPSKGGC
jgi:hypothetical protein